MAKHRILIVEDEGLVAMDIQATLTKLGYEVISIVASGEEAVREAGETLPDLVLMDIMLAGGMDGTEAAALIQQDRHVPVVYLTAYDDDEILNRAKMTGPYGYIHKPFNEKELKTSVEIALYKHGMERALRESEERLTELNKNLERRVSEEIGRRMEQEQLVIQQSKMAAMGEMINVIAHQWRQPLNSVGLIVQALQDAYKMEERDEAAIAEAVNHAVNQIRFMSRTIDDFRDFFKPSKEKTVFDVKKEVGETISIISAQLKNHAITYSLTCRVHDKTFRSHAEIDSCGEMLVDGYRNEFKQALLNILNNAKDAIINRKAKGLMEEGEEGAIDAYFDVRQERVFIGIQDNGGGIPEDIVDRIFEPYFTTKGESLGTGIGLYMTKTIIEKNMGGRVAGINVDKGALFTVELLSAVQPSKAL